MYAIQLRDGRMEWSEVAEVHPAPSELLIDIEAAGVNRADLMQRAGNYPPPPGAPTTLGLECAGVVRAVGSAVSGWRIGQPVCALLSGGGYAEQVCVDASLALPIPAGLSAIEAAGLPEAAATAWSNLAMTGRMQSGDIVVIHGGSGGVGTLAIQIARAAGAQVIATAGGPERTRRCEQLGAHLAIDYRDAAVDDAVLQATGGRGADLVLDVVGAGLLDANLAMLAPQGRLVIIGMLAGHRAEIDLAPLVSRWLTIAGTNLRSRPLEQRRAIIAAVRAQVWPWVESGAVRPVIDRTVPLPDAAAAHAALAGGEVFGKVVLVRP